MLNREDKKFLRGVFSKYDYIMTTSQLKEEKLFYRNIQKFLNDGHIEKIKRGYYVWVIDKNVSRNCTSIDYPFVKAYRVEPPLVTVGEITGEIDYIKIRIYDCNRTICDILRNMNRMDKEVLPSLSLWLHELS